MEPSKNRVTDEELQLLNLLGALLERPDATKDGEANLRREYPDAPDESVRAFAHHLYRELPHALLGFLGEIERSLEDGGGRIDPGKTWHLLYHLYNLVQLEALMPWCREDLVSEINAAIVALEGDDRKFALNTMIRLRDLSRGEMAPPALVDDGRES